MVSALFFGFLFRKDPSPANQNATTDGMCVAGLSFVSYVSDTGLLHCRRQHRRLRRQRCQFRICPRCFALGAIGSCCRSRRNVTAALCLSLLCTTRRCYSCRCLFLSAIVRVFIFSWEQNADYVLFMGSSKLWYRSQTRRLSHGSTFTWPELPRSEGRNQK